MDDLRQRTTAVVLADHVFDHQLFALWASEENMSDLGITAPFPSGDVSCQARPYDGCGPAASGRTPSSFTENHDAWSASRGRVAPAVGRLSPYRIPIMRAEKQTAAPRIANRLLSLPGCVQVEHEPGLVARDSNGVVGGEDELKAAGDEQATNQPRRA